MQHRLSLLELPSGHVVADLVVLEEFAAEPTLCRRLADVPRRERLTVDGGKHVDTDRPGETLVGVFYCGPERLQVLRTLRFTQFWYRKRPIDLKLHAELTHRLKFRLPNHALCDRDELRRC